MLLHGPHGQSQLNGTLLAQQPIERGFGPRQSSDFDISGGTARSMLLRRDQTLIRILEIAQLQVEQRGVFLLEPPGDPTRTSHTYRPPTVILAIINLPTHDDHP